MVDAEVDTVRMEARGAHAQLVDMVARLDPGATALVRKQPTRYKNFKNRGKRVPIKEIMELAKNNSENPAVDPSRCLVLVALGPEGQRTKEELDYGKTVSQIVPRLTQHEEELKLTHNKLEEWLSTAQERKVRSTVVSLVAKYRALFPDELPDGLPPPRILDMTSVTVPGAIVPKGGTPRCTPQEIETLRGCLQQYLQKRWIQRSVSPYAAPVMSVPKKGDPPGSPGSRMVITYRPLNAVTFVSEIPLPLSKMSWCVSRGLSGSPPWIWNKDSTKSGWHQETVIIQRFGHLWGNLNGALCLSG